MLDETQRKKPLAVGEACPEIGSDLFGLKERMGNMKNKNLNLKIDADLALISADAPSERILEIVVTPPVAEKKLVRPAFNLAFVIDRSGSMSGGKLECVKEAVMNVVDLLEEKDRACLVVFDDEVRTVVESGGMAPAFRKELKRAISQLQTGGSTNLVGGWVRGCDEIAKTQLPDGINRCLLLTDGQANVGESDPEQLAMHTRELSRRGITTTTFGVGVDYNHELLEAMANAGSGNYYFIENPEQSKELFRQELEGLREVTARAVEISLKLPTGFKPQVLSTWPTELKGHQLKISLGDMISGLERHVFIKLGVPPAAKSDHPKIAGLVRGRANNGDLLENIAEIVFAPVDAKGLADAKPELEILRGFALVYMADISRDAIALKDRREDKKAVKLLEDALNQYRDLLDPREAARYARILEELKGEMSMANRKFHRESSHMLNQCMVMAPDRYKRK
jgi:Ca-activated chloride channel homolog